MEAVLTHFHDDVVFTSPVAADVVPESAGVVRGKAALRQYWCAALQAVPDLHFDIVGVYRGMSTLVINYRNQKGGLVNEVSSSTATSSVAATGRICPSPDRPALPCCGSAALKRAGTGGGHGDRRRFVVDPRDHPLGAVRDDPSRREGADGRA